MFDFVNILIADDDVEDQLIISESLKTFFPADSLRFAEDGAALLGMLHSMQPGQHVDLIILDLNMPRLNGIETLRQLKATPLFQHIPVLILSTSINPAQKKECMSLGAAYYLVKPCSYNEMMALGASISGFVNTLAGKIA